MAVGALHGVDPLDHLFERILTLEEIDKNIYRGVTPPGSSFLRIFGGQTIAQALRAAGHTVNDLFIVHSLHSTFLLPGDPNSPVLYHVDRIRDGKSFATRTVKATQQGEAIFNATISFQKLEPGLEHFDKMPDAPLPETLLTTEQIIEKMILEKIVDPGLIRSFTAYTRLPFPVDMRRVTDPDAQGLLTGRKSVSTKQLAWFRAKGTIASDCLFMHQCAAAYMSDWSILTGALLPHGENYYSGHIQSSSLDHSMWFHAPFRADTWMLFETESPRAGGGRGLCTGKLFSSDGRLVVSCAQEGLIRVMRPNDKLKRKSPFLKSSL